MTTTIVGIGIGGLGGLETRQLDAMDGVSVVAGADPNADARAAFADAVGGETYESVERMLQEFSDADAATVASPHTLHHEQVTACLDAGMDVHVEKPMVTDLDDAVDLVSTVRERDAVLQVGYQRHFDPRYEELRRLVAGGRIGEPRFANCYLEQDWLTAQAGSWRTDPALSGGGQLYDSGSHLLDALLWTTDTEPREVAALVERRDADVDVDTALSVGLERPDGGRLTASVGVTAGGTTGPDVGEGLVVHGTAGSVEYDGERVSVTERDGGHTYTATVEGDTDYRTLTREKLSAFVDAVRGEREVAVPAEVGLRVTALTEAAYRAADRGETVDVQALLAEARERTGASA